MRRLLVCLTLSLLLANTTGLFAAEKIDMKKRAEEFKSLKWGMFICWSFSTYSAKEWTPGIEDISYFKATKCDTDQWARTAKEAGMGYILFLTKHHDGFCLWDTKTTDRKITNAPLGYDVLAKLKKSCDKYDIKLALYFSESEWRWSDKPDGTRYRRNGGHNPEMKKAQLKELLTQYGPIEYLWFDWAIGDGGLSHKDTVAFVKSFQPGCFAGFNFGDQDDADLRLGERGGAGPISDATTAGPYIKKYMKLKKYKYGTKYLAAEFTYPILPPHKGGALWFYSLPEHDNLCHPAEKLYKDYLGAVKHGNLFSIDIGPDYNGKIREIDVKTLMEVKSMIDKHDSAQEEN